MQKKVMALAVAGALAAPAAMAQVQIGGGIHLQYYAWDSGFAGSKKTDVLSTSEPELYIRGEEKLGGGLSTWFQCTSSFDVIGTQAQTASSGWCGRNSAIGFRGGFGNVFFGTWDTPQKLVTNLARGWWGGTNTLQGGSMVLLQNGAASNVGNNGGVFFKRATRSINYHSPDWSGFNLNAAFTAANEATALPESSDLKPRLYSLGATFRTGPFFAGLGYEIHQDYNPASVAGYTGGDDTSMNVTVGFTIAGAVRLSLAYYMNDYELGNAAAAKVENDGFAFYVDWTISGPHKLYAQYAQVADGDGTAGASVGSFRVGTDTGSEVFGVAYGYSMSKRTQLYAAYNEMKNDANANFTFGTSAGTNGGKQKAIGIGLRHSF